MLADTASRSWVCWVASMFSGSMCPNDRFAGRGRRRTSALPARTFQEVGVAAVPSAGLRVVKCAHRAVLTFRRCAGVGDTDGEDPVVAGRRAAPRPRRCRTPPTRRGRGSSPRTSETSWGRRPRPGGTNRSRCGRRRGPSRRRTSTGCIPRVRHHVDRLTGAEEEVSGGYLADPPPACAPTRPPGAPSRPPPCAGRRPHRRGACRLASGSCRR